MPRHNPVFEHAADLAERSMRWLDRFWDDRAGLLRFPGDFSDAELNSDAPLVGNARHAVRETGPYVVGLLMRGTDVGRRRADAALRAMLRYQIDEPATPYHGTFYRYLDEPHPGANAIIWKDYDPNWRQFIGTTFTLILDAFADDLAADLIAGMERAVRLAVVGETDRVEPHYTNIALMKAALDVWAGHRFGEPEWIDRGLAMANAIDVLFRPHETFSEYNSPTYYGVNLAALQYWKRSPSPLLRARGAAMEAALWRDVARFYHAGMRNLCGPFDRSYGMDMRRYAALIGLWIWIGVGRELAPFPDLTRPFDHRHDLTAGPLFALLGTAIPEDVRLHLKSFCGERQIERIIDDQRIATAWIGQRIMLGGECGNRSISNQYHAATMHWLISGGVGTMKLVHDTPVDAVATQNNLLICAPATDRAAKCSLESGFDSDSPIAFDGAVLRLPELQVRVDSNLQTPNLQINALGSALRFEIPPKTDWRIALTVESSPTRRFETGIDLR